jgi:hypothetical protein
MTWEGFAEHRIREAEAAGLFSDLPGAGQPIPGIDDPLDENWWVKRKLREEGLSVVPPVLEARLAKERVLASLAYLESEHEVRRRLDELNRQIIEAGKSIVSGPADGVAPVDIDLQVKEWRRTRGIG